MKQARENSWGAKTPHEVDFMKLDYSDTYNTVLNKEQEAQYQTWAKSVGRERDVRDYDLRGAWLDSSRGI